MINTKYVVTPDPKNSNYWTLHCLEKNFKLSVQRSYAWLMDQSLYHYEFFHLQDGKEKRLVSYADYEYYAYRRSIMLKDSDDAAIWFVGEYLGYLELAYCFPWLDHEIGTCYRDETKPAEPFDTDVFFEDDAVEVTSFKFKQSKQ